MIDFITNFITNLSWFGIISYSVMSFIVLTAISHRIQFRMMKIEKRMSGATHEETESWKRQLQNADIKDWPRISLGSAQESPIALALSRLLKAPERLQRLQEIERILMLEIDRLFSPLESASEKLKSAAPAWGMFFTIVGLMFATNEFGESGSVIKMLAAIGPALGTTALGAIAAIIEKSLIYSRLLPVQGQMRRDGSLFFMEVADLYARKIELKEKLMNAAARPHSLPTLPKTDKSHVIKTKGRIKRCQ